MKKRIKFVTPLTRNLAEEMLGDIATLTLELNDNKITMDREIAAVREKYESPIAKLGEQIDDKVAVLDAWAKANPEEFPKNRKSIEFVHGVIGYRTGTPKLKTLGRLTWDAILKSFEALKLTQFIRIKSEVDKEAIISQHAQSKIDDAYLRKLSLQVVQDETFFVEPKLEELTSRAQKEAA